MREEPISREELEQLVAEANKGHKKTIFMSWLLGGSEMIVTTVWLTQETELRSNDMLENVDHNWDSPKHKVCVERCFGGLNAIFDNYWMAYRHSLLTGRKEHKK